MPATAMHDNTTFDDLEINYGTAILSDLCGQHLTRNQQPVRLFDETRHTAEFYYRADKRGKPYIRNFQNEQTYYPVTAYSLYHGIDFNAAKNELYAQYSIQGSTNYNRPPLRPLKPRKQPEQRPVDYLPLEQYQRCQTHFERNGFHEYLRFTYGLEAANEAFARYRLGTSKYWRYDGYLTTTLPQFDVAGNLRQVKIIVFDFANGRRVKHHQPAEKWNESLKQYQPTEPDADKSKVYGRYLFGKGYQDHNLEPCFFGEHLLPEYPEQAVAIVEGESTAITGSILYPKYLWLATGGKNGCRWTDPNTFSVLYGRDVTLWPDADAHEQWTEKAKPLRPLVQSLQVSDYVKRNTPEGSKSDLRDLATRPYYFPGDGAPPVFGEALTLEPSDTYPPEWDEPGKPDEVPTIKPLSFHEWQRQHPPFNQLGLASLKQ